MNLIEMKAFIDKRARDLFFIFLNNEPNDDDHESWFSSTLMNEGVYTLDINTWLESDGSVSVYNIVFKAAYYDAYDNYDENVSFNIPASFLDQVLDEEKVIEWWKNYQKSVLVQQEWENLDRVLAGICQENLHIVEKAIVKFKELNKDPNNPQYIIPWLDRRELFKEAYGEIPVVVHKPSFNE